MKVVISDNPPYFLDLDAADGSILVEALDPDGNVIEGFASQDCTPITTDSARHRLQWNDNPDCQLIQARPIDPLPSATDRPPARAWLTNECRPWWIVKSACRSFPDARHATR